LYALLLSRFNHSVIAGKSSSSTYSPPCFASNQHVNSTPRNTPLKKPTNKNSIT
jgi:hypothetical protein